MTLDAPGYCNVVVVQRKAVGHVRLYRAHLQDYRRKDRPSQGAPGMRPVAG